MYKPLSINNLVLFGGKLGIEASSVAESGLTEHNKIMTFRSLSLLGRDPSESSSFWRGSGYFIVVNGVFSFFDRVLVERLVFTVMYFWLTACFLGLSIRS